jgi:predicted nucleic acid-binding protein
MLRLELGYRWEAAAASALHQLIYRLGEILVGPYKLGSSQTARQIREVFREPLVEVIPYPLETADFYGRIRAQHGVSPVDSIRLACAAQAQIDLFLTNDAALVGKIIPGIQFIAGLDSNLF